MLGQNVPYFRCGSVSVVCGGKYHQSYTAWTVAFVYNLFVVLSAQLTGSLLYSPLYGLRGHVGPFGVFYGSSEPRVVFWVWSSLPDCYGDLPYDL